MTTRMENVFRMRDLLDNPSPSKPSFHQLFRQELSEEQTMVNDLNNTGQPWATATYQLNSNPNLDTYEINVSDFGKVLYVVRVSGSPWIKYVTVPFNDVNDQMYGVVWTNWANVYGSFFQPNETPERMSFYREGVLNSQIKVKLNPLPMQGWSYIITYLPGAIGSNDPLESAIQMPEHAELVQLRGAMALLPYAEWGDDAVANTERRKQLAAGFEYQLSRKEPIFATYKHSINIPKPAMVADWND